jgi:hypothetical protein
VANLGYSLCCLDRRRRKKGGYYAGQSDGPHLSDCAHLDGSLVVRDERFAHRHGEECFVSGGVSSSNEEQVEAFMKNRAPNDEVTCQKTKGDWEFVCDVTHFPGGGHHHATVEKYKWGIVTDWVSPVQSLEGLTLSSPTPTTREENKRRLNEETNQRVLSGAPFVWNEVGDYQFQAMGIDRALARQLENAVRLPMVKRVDDLLAVPGIDKATVDKIRRTSARRKATAIVAGERHELFVAAWSLILQARS